MSPQHLLLMIVIDLIWGLNFVMAKIGVTEIPPLLLLVFRFALTLIVLAPFLRWKHGMMREVLAVAVLGGILQFGLFFTGTAFSTASVAAIIAQLQLPFATILSILLLHEHVGWRRWAGIGIVMGGLLVLAFDPIILHYWVGALFCAVACVATAFSQIIMRRMKEIGVFELQAWIAVITTPGMLILSFLFERGDWHKLGEAPLHLWGIVFYVAILANILGQGGMFFLLKRYDVALVVTLTVLAQVFGIIFGVVLLSEPMTWRTAIGAAVICIGVVIIAARQGRAASAEAALPPASAPAGVVPAPLKAEATEQIVKR